MEQARVGSGGVLISLLRGGQPISAWLVTGTPAQSSRQFLPGTGLRIPQVDDNLHSVLCTMVHLRSTGPTCGDVILTGATSAVKLASLHNQAGIFEAGRNKSLIPGRLARSPLTCTSTWKAWNKRFVSVCSEPERCSASSDPWLSGLKWFHQLFYYNYQVLNVCFQSDNLKWRRNTGRYRPVVACMLSNWRRVWLTCRYGMLSGRSLYPVTPLPTHTVLMSPIECQLRRGRVDTTFF